MLDKLYITPRQWLRILRWTLYAALFLLALLVQTVVFGNRTILGAHPDLVAIVITCVCLREGPERGGTFALIASLVWCLSGIDQGSVCLLVLTVLPVLGSILCRAALVDCLASARMSPAFSRMTVTVVMTLSFARRAAAVVCV